MSTQLSPFQQAGVPSEADAEALRQSHQVSSDTTPSGGGMQYLKMNQADMAEPGEITYGAEHTVIDYEGEWVVNTLGAEHGFLLMPHKGSTPIDETWSFVSQPKPSPEYDSRGEWKEARKATLLCISGKDIGVKAEFGGAAAGHLEFYKTVSGAVAHESEDTAVLPVMRFQVSSFYSNNWGKTFYRAVPVIDRWMTMEDLVAHIQASEGPKKTPPKAKAKAKAKAPATKTRTRQRKAG